MIRQLNLSRGKKVYAGALACAEPLGAGKTVKLDER